MAGAPVSSRTARRASHRETFMPINRRPQHHRRRGPAPIARCSTPSAPGSRLQETDDRRRQRASTITPCNSGLQRLAGAAARRLQEAGGNADLRHRPSRRHGDGRRRHGAAWSREVTPIATRPASAGGGWTACWWSAAATEMPGGRWHPARQRASVHVYGGTILPGSLQEQGPQHRRRVRGGRRIHVGPHDRNRLRSRAAHPEQRLVRRHVHRRACRSRRSA